MTMLILYTILTLLFICCTILILRKSINLSEEQKKQDELIKENNQLHDVKIVLEKDLQVLEQKIEKLQLQIDVYSNAKTQYIERLEDSYDEVEQEYKEKVNSLHKNLENAENQLTEIKNQISAAAKAQLREREKEEQIDFYKLSVSPIDLEDIKKLESIKKILHNPTILSKLIWSTYFQKQTNELCNRVFGVNSVCGIYKITNLITKQCYVGQSLNTQDRIKQHIKCGLGIDAPATNKLYNSMQQDGVWNFSFELLEKCPKDKLDEAEKKWIEIYQSNKVGLNVTKGGSGK